MKGKKARVPVLKKHYELYKAANLSKAYWLSIVTQVMSLRQLPNMRLSRLMLINAAGADTVTQTVLLAFNKLDNLEAQD